jgi:hypothetical protein
VTSKDRSAALVVTTSALWRFAFASMARLEAAWRASALARHMATERRTATVEDVISNLGTAVLAAAVVHAALLSMAPSYARPAYGPIGALVCASAAALAVAANRPLAAAWRGSRLRRGINRVTSNRTDV